MPPFGAANSCYEAGSATAGAMMAVRGFEKMRLSLKVGTSALSWRRVGHRHDGYPEGAPPRDGTES